MIERPLFTDADPGGPPPFRGAGRLKHNGYGVGMPPLTLRVSPRT